MKRFVRVEMRWGSGSEPPIPNHGARRVGGGSFGTLDVAESRPHRATVAIAAPPHSACTLWVEASDHLPVPPRSAEPGANTVDEHFAVDVDAGWRQPWLDCADVLYGSRPQRTEQAARRLDHWLRAHPGCALAAVPLTDGGWAAADRRESCRVWHRTVPGPAPNARFLLPSCLHAWLAAGNELSALRSATIVTLC